MGADVVTGRKAWHIGAADGKRVEVRSGGDCITKGELVLLAGDGIDPNATLVDIVPLDLCGAEERRRNVAKRIEFEHALGDRIEHGARNAVARVRLAGQKIDELVAGARIL